MPESVRHVRRDSARRPAFRPAVRIGVGAFVLLAVLVGAWTAWKLRSESPRVTIGVEGRRQVYVAGPPLSAVPFTPGDAVSLRIADVRPRAGGYSYDLRFIAYGPGRHDLTKYLVDARQARPAESPELAIQVDSILPKDFGGSLFDTAASPIDLHSRYRLWIGLSWAAWGLLLAPLLLFGRSARRKVDAVAPRPPADERLKTLLMRATHERLSAEQQADVERLLIEFWSLRLNLSSERLAATVEELRRHPLAGRQLALIESRFHSRQSAIGGVWALDLWNELAVELSQAQSVATAEAAS